MISRFCNLKRYTVLRCNLKRYIKNVFLNIDKKIKFQHKKNLVILYSKTHKLFQF